MLMSLDVKTVQSDARIMHAVGHLDYSFIEVSSFVTFEGFL